MSRRAKLTLAFSRDAPKKQASGFEWTAAPSDPVQAKSKTSHPPGAKTEQAEAPAKKAQAVHKRGRTVAPPVPWSNGRKLLKVAVVVIATALSLYLLKRRFF